MGHDALGDDSYVRTGRWFPASQGLGLFPHFLVLHRMVRKTLTPRIDYSEAIPAYERNLLDALMKPVCFNIFEYILDEIWNIATNPLRSYVFARYIQFMIEMWHRRSSTRICAMTLFIL
jgi:hypothetical protein